MPDPAASLAELLPSDLNALIQPLLTGALVPVDELRRQVVGYRAALRSAAQSQAWPDMDFELGDRCGVACEDLLDRVGAWPEPWQHRLLQVAVRYYVLSEDEEDDLESLVGFDDDAMVLNACARALGLEAAVIPLAPR